MTAEQTFTLLVGLFCVSVIGLAVLFAVQTVALVLATRNLARDKNTIGQLNKLFDVSKRISAPLTLAVYGCAGFAVFGFPEMFDELIRSHTSLAVAFGIFFVGSSLVQIFLSRRLKRATDAYAERNGSES